MLLLLLSGAVVRYYETKRKIYLQSLPENKQKADQQTFKKEKGKLCIFLNVSLCSTNIEC